MSRAELGAARRRLRNTALRVLVTSPIGNAFRILRDPAIKQGVLYVPGVGWLADSAKATIALLPGETQSRVKKLIARTKSADGGSSGSNGLSPVLSRIDETSFSAFHEVAFDIGKASRLLGYEPAVDFEEGMARTEAWIRWAGI
jgi:hypothetical protein